MTKNADLGQKGEELAADYFTKKGHSILHRNWRHSHYEIDLITIKDGMLHFVEVKTRSSENFGKPEESVRSKKLKDVFRAAEEFLFQHKQYKDFRVDILSVTIFPGTEPRFFLVEDVYL